MKFAYVTAMLFCLCSQTMAADNEGFALGTSAAAAYRSPNNVNEAGKGFETTMDRNDTDLQALVSQPIQSPAQHGVQNPVVLEPKKPWTQAQRDQFANMTQGQGVYDMACTQAIKDALAAQGIQINCRTAPSGNLGYCDGQECTGD
jgi:hypothetical protein